MFLQHVDSYCANLSQAKIFQKDCRGVLRPKLPCLCLDLRGWFASWVSFTHCVVGYIDLDQFRLCEVGDPSNREVKEPPREGVCVCVCVLGV